MIAPTQGGWQPAVASEQYLGCCQSPRNPSESLGVGYARRSDSAVIDVRVAPLCLVKVF